MFLLKNKKKAGHHNAVVNKGLLFAGYLAAVRVAYLTFVSFYPEAAPVVK